MSLAVIGANGQLGADVVAAFEGAGEITVRLTHADIDVSSIDSTRSALSGIWPTVIVNTAAMHNVENCEKDPLRAYQVNALGARNLAFVARELGAKLVHVSTDYVFNGLKGAPYVESDLPAPLNVYANTKVSGEQYIRAVSEKYFILRTSALYGRSPCRGKGGKNFVETMLKLATEHEELCVVDDEFVSPTSTEDLANQIVILSQTHHYGLYHATSEGSCSWFEFAKAIFQLANVKVNLKRASPGQFPSKVPRPKYSILENAELKKKGLNYFRPWTEGLENYLAHRSAPLEVSGPNNGFSV